MQSILHPAGVDAAHIELLWWFLFGISVVVFIVVMGFLVYGVFVPREHQPGDEKTKTKFVAGGAIITLAILMVILLGSIVVGRSNVRGPDTALTIEVIAHQWWWEVRYLDPSPHRIVTTANEVHLPVGERVRFQLSSRDVIHSFWIPNLAGKIDMFPDRENTLWVEPTETGVFRGQCAEFCGMQHAKMAFVAVVHEPAEFEAWLDRERASAVPPADPLAQRGHDAFMTGTCATCHMIRGTAAMSAFGPELTHIGSRRTLAAGTMPNDRGRLAAWIVDPQQFKPGSHMPATTLDAETLMAVVHYLEQLR